MEQEYATPLDVKRVLIAGGFDRREVSVRRGSGTAHSWIHAYVYITKQVCTCEHYEGNCEGCLKYKEELNTTKNKIDELVKGLKFYTFYSDDGYNTEYDCFLSQIYAGNYMQRKLNRL